MRHLKFLLIVILIILFLALIGLTFGTMYFTNFLVKSADKLFYKFELEKTYKTQVGIIEPKNNSNLLLGFTSDNLEFGIIPLGSVSKRFLTLTNNNEENYKIILKVSGNISPMVKFNKNDFILAKDENMSVTVFLDSSIGLVPGNYTGEIFVISSRPKFSFLNNLVGNQ